MTPDGRPYHGAAIGSLDYITRGSPILDGPEVYEERDSAQREAEGPRASMDYSEFTLLDTKKNRSNVPEFEPYESRIARRSHARVPLQSAVGLALSLALA